MKIYFLIIAFILLLSIISSIVYKFNKKESGFANSYDPYEKPHTDKKLITKEHCHKIMNYAKDKLFQSNVVGGQDLRIRDSMQCWIPKTNEIVKPIFEKVCQKYNIPFKNAEALQVVRYKADQYYNEHHDSCCENNDKCKEFVKRGGQRILTVLIYLNDEFNEGYTYFKNMDLKLKADPGDAIVFYPLAKNSNKCHPLALHAGMPISSGEKWIANIWFREKEFI